MTTLNVLVGLMDGEIVETIPNDVLMKLRELIRTRKTGTLAFDMKDGVILKGQFTEHWSVKR